MRSPRSGRQRILVLATALALDLAFSEPSSRLHPVNWIGAGISGLERRAPRRGRALPLLYGTVCTLGVTCVSAGAARQGERILGRLPAPVRVLLLAILLKPAFSLRMLLGAGRAVGDRLRSEDLAGARTALGGLVSRETSLLDKADCAAAAIESLAENTTDSVTGPWLAYALFGLPGAWAFRAINTFDSRWGYHGVYEWLGRFSAKLDDVAACLPARVSAILLIAAMSFTGGDWRRALSGVARDRRKTASPNAGWTMSAMAGGLGLRLNKPGQYDLNPAGRAAEAVDVARAEKAVLGAAGGALLLAAIVMTMVGRIRVAGRV